MNFFDEFEKQNKKAEAQAPASEGQTINLSVDDVKAIFSKSFEEFKTGLIAEINTQLKDKSMIQKPDTDPAAETPAESGESEE